MSTWTVLDALLDEQFRLAMRPSIYQLLNPRPTYTKAESKLMRKLGRTTLPWR